MLSEGGPVKTYIAIIDIIAWFFSMCPLPWFRNYIPRVGWQIPQKS